MSFSLKPSEPEPAPIDAIDAPKTKPAISQLESQPVSEDDEETFLLSSLPKEQICSYKRKLSRELKTLIDDNEILPPVTVVDLDKEQMQLASSLFKSTAGAIAANRGNKILEQIAEATEASWVNKEKALEWLTNFLSRTMRQNWMLGAMKWLDTNVGTVLGVKPIPVSDTKIVYAHLDDCVQEAIDLLQASNNDILDSQEEEDSDEDSDDSDNDDDSDKSISGSYSDDEDDDSSSSILDIDEAELKAEAKIAGIKNKKRKLVEDEVKEEEEAK